MGLTLAVKRSYRYFIPAILLTPRELIRRSFASALFFVLGITTGMYWYAQPGSQSEHVAKVSCVLLWVLTLLKWWAEGTPSITPHSPPMV